jgi:hypothetical protein
MSQMDGRFEKVDESLRFHAKVARPDMDPSTCWTWTAARHPTGYGFFHRHGRLALAHRVAYERALGPIPEGMQVCHRCDNRLCVRPLHLFVGTALDNSRDMLAKGRCKPPVYARTLRPHCAHGHLYTTENTGYRTQDGRVKRVCIACRDMRNAARNRSVKAGR